MGSAIRARGIDDLNYRRRCEENMGLGLSTQSDGGGSGLLSNHFHEIVEGDRSNAATVKGYSMTWWEKTLEYLMKEKLIPPISHGYLDYAVEEIEQRVRMLETRALLMKKEQDGF